MLSSYLRLSGLALACWMALPAQEKSNARTVVDNGVIDTVPPEVRARRSMVFGMFSTPQDILRNDPRTPGMMSAASLKPMAELPSGESDTILIGRVEEVHSHLMTNRGGIYREFTIQVNELLSEKVPSSLSAPTESQTAVRIAMLKPGGTLALSDGTQFTHEFQGYGRELEAGGRYVLFLRKRLSCQCFVPVKAWELRDGAAHPMSPDDIAAASMNRSVYAGMKEDLFLARVRLERAQLEPIR
jgi:hypothetical protein